MSQVELNEQLSFLPVLCQFTQICHLVVPPAVKCFAVKVSYYRILRMTPEEEGHCFCISSSSTRALGTAPVPAY